MTKFLALAKADIDEVIKINDSLVTAEVEPVYQHGYEFSGEVLIAGSVHDNADEETIAEILHGYLCCYVEDVLIRKVEIRSVRPQRVVNIYRKAG